MKSLSDSQVCFPLQFLRRADIFVKQTFCAILILESQVTLDVLCLVDN